MRPPDASENEDSLKSLRARLRPTTVVVLLAVGASLGLAAHRVAGNLTVMAQPPAQREAEPLLIRNGERVTIPEGSPLRSKLVVSAVAEREIVRTLVLPAVVEADPGRLIKVLPPLAGRITQLKVQLGQRVEAGQPLAVLESPDLSQAQADHERAEVTLQLAAKTRDRQRELAKIGGAALKDLQQAETDYVTAQAEDQRAEARLRQIGVDPSQKERARSVTIVAPMAGSIIDLAVGPGAYWNDPTAALMTIADLRTIWVTANVPEKDTALIAKGQRVEVAFPAYPNESRNGEVLFVSDVLDPDTRRTKVRIAFDNRDIRLKPNMFANVTFAAPMQLLPAVPTTALVLKEDADRVFVEVEPWSFEPRTVEVGFQQGSDAIIQSGLKAGDRIIVKGGILLND